MSVIQDLYLQTLTVSDFKAYFYRDFASAWSPYNKWLSTINYVINDTIYYTDFKVYKALVANINIIPTSDPLKWAVQPTINIFSYIIDEDINRAFEEAYVKLPWYVFMQENDIKKIIFFYLIAHNIYISNNLMTGLNSTVQYAEGSKSIGSVSVSYNVPPFLLEKDYIQLRKSAYGEKYIDLLSLYYMPMIGIVDGSIL